MAKDLKFGDIDVPGIPEDEPVFIIRAQDIASIDAILGYATEAEDHGAAPELLSGVMNVVSKFEQWRSANPERVKIPD